jgi:hypothetical protein
MANAAGQTVYSLYLPAATGLNFHRLAALPQIGLWETYISGTSSTSEISGTPTTYEMEITGNSASPATYDVDILFSGDLTPSAAASPPANYKLTGTAAGSWVDINGVLNSEGIPGTGVVGGELRGTFDPAAATVRAATMGAWVETGKFLTMAGDATTTETANATLRALNIPAVQVGKATLSGSTENGMNINMNNVIFFATSTGGNPRIWATNNVGGTYNTNNNYSGTSVPLSGNGLNANFNVQTWDQTGGKWHSTVTNGQGTYSGTGAMNNTSINFRGAAAGTMSGGTLTGTAAGTAKTLSVD